MSVWMAGMNAGAGVALEMASRFEGFRVVGSPEAPLAVVIGPLPGLYGIRSGADAAAELVLLAEHGMPRQGNLSFWLQTDRAYHAQLDLSPAGEACPHGGGISAFAEQILSGPVSFSLHSVHTDFRIIFGLEGGPRDLSLLPGLPGPAWYHVALEWDAPRGIQNIWINGVPARPLDFPQRPWSMPDEDRLKLHLRRFAVSDLRLRDGVLDRAALRHQVTPAYWENARHLLGAPPGVANVIGRNQGRRLYENPLGAASDVDDWMLEGPATLGFEDGWMRLASERQPDHPGHFVYWCPVETPDDFIVEWEIQVLKPSLAIIFFCARARDGMDLFDERLERRDGLFPRYHSGEMDAYHISYYTHSRPTTNLRKNHGFFLAAVGANPMQFSPARVFRVQLMKNGGHIQLAVDGEVVLDFLDDGQTFGPVLPGGRIGLRQMAGMDARYRDFRVYAIRPEQRPVGDAVPDYGEMPKTYQRRPSR